MKILEHMVATPLAQALGWTLLHSLWQGVVAAVVVGATLMSTRSPRVRYAVACLALLGLVTSTAFTLVRVMPESGRAQVAVSVPIALAPLGNGPEEFTRAHPSVTSVVPWLAPFWIAGVWILALRQIAGWMAASRLRRRGVCSPPPGWQRQMEELQARLRIARPVLLLESFLADVPVVIGHLRPAILMPLGMLAGLSPAQIESILLHELAHIRRCDYLVNLLQRSVECLLFYHPAVWWMSTLIQDERENCCDDVVAENCGDIHEYAVALTALERNRRPDAQPLLAATGGSLMRRIRRLLYPTTGGGAWSPFFAVVILVGTAAAAYAAWPAHRNPEPVAPQVQTAQAGQAYQKWLNEDVRYIVTDQERSRYLSLTSDQSRDAFIEQFWTRRDPAGTPPNTFKAEHYRRIAYANVHYAGSVPGWQSDRGRIYIQVGPPDQVDAHPNAAPPYETWTYRAKELSPSQTFTFVDRSGNGDYHLGAVGAGVRSMTTDHQTITTPPPSPPPRPTESSTEPQTARSSSSQVIARAARAQLQDVRFAGVTQLSPDEQNKCADQLKAVTYGGTWQPQIAERARVLCWQHNGYFKARVTPEFQRLADRDGIEQYSVILTVNEGAQYRLKGISFTNNHVFSSSELRPMFKIGDGDVLDMDAIRQAISTVREAYGSRGFFDMAMVPNSQVDDVNRTVELVVDISETRTTSQTPREGTIRISEGVAMGNLAHRVDPVYPAVAQAARISADVVLRIVIGKDGKVVNITVMSGHPMLVQAAMDAVRQWVFKPYFLNGEPVEVTTQITIPFRLPAQ